MSLHKETVLLCLAVTAGSLLFSSCKTNSTKTTSRSRASYGESSEWQDEMETKATYRGKYVSSDNRLGGAHRRANDNIEEAKRRYGVFGQGGNNGFSQNSVTASSSNFSRGNGSAGSPATGGSSSVGGGATSGGGASSLLGNTTQGLNVPGVNINLPGGLGL